jgi:hypothetical protein
MQELKAQAEACTLRARVMANHAAFGERPAAGWSAAECVAHLSRSSEELLPLIEDATRRAETALDSYRLTWKERLLIWFLEPPYRMKVSTKGDFEPAVGDASEVLPDFEKSQLRLDRALERAKGRAIDGVQIESPFDKNVHYSAWAALNVLLAHQRRHLWQAEQTLSRLGR